MRTKKKEYKYKDLVLDSKGELELCYWFEELREAGYISSWKRATVPMKLTNGLSHRYLKVTELKTKVKEEKKVQTLLKESEYTPDFIVNWTKKAENVFYQTLESENEITCPFVSQKQGGTSIVEVKPSLRFDPHNMLRVFRMNQKFIWEKFGIFVSLVVAEDLFKATFTPSEVTIPAARKPKQEKWKRTTLKQYLTNLK